MCFQAVRLLLVQLDDSSILASSELSIQDG
jgi:hypothetical protein